MQIQSIDKSQHYNNMAFQGNVNIVNDLSYLPCKYVRKSYDSIVKMMEDKPFDLFIKQEHKTGNLHFIAKKPEHVFKKDAPCINSIIGDASRMDDGESTKDLYVAVARDAVNGYDNYIIPELAFSMSSRIKRFVGNIHTKLSNLTK